MSDIFFSFPEYTDMMLMYGKGKRNSVEARRLYAEQFPKRTLPDAKTFDDVANTLRETGSFLPKDVANDDRHRLRSRKY